MKEAEASVLEEFLGPSEFANHGERVVTGQRLMQATSDIFLGWLHVDSGLDEKPRDFYGRQLKDWKGSAEIELMVPRHGRLRQAVRLDARPAHARSGDRIAIASYLGNGDSFDRAILEFSKAYAEQNDRDYQRSPRGQIRPDHRPRRVCDVSTAVVNVAAAAADFSRGAFSRIRLRWRRATAGFRDSARSTLPGAGRASGGAAWV